MALFVPKTLINLKKIKGAGEITYSPQEWIAGWRVSRVFTMSRALRRCVQHYPCWLKLVMWWRTSESVTWQPSGEIWLMQIINPTRQRPWSRLDASVELTNRNRVRKVKLADFLLGSTKPLWSGMNYSPLFWCRHRRRYQVHLLQIYHALIRGSALRRRRCVGAVFERICEEARVVVGAVSPAPVVCDRSRSG